MAIVRTMSELKIRAPPPSPIPTASGSRSAANETLSEFLENSLRVPDLTLPSAHSRHQPSPPEIDRHSLASRESGTVDSLLRSVRVFGAFRISYHGISGEELRSLVKEAARVFGVLEKRDTGFRQHYGVNREEIVWVRWRDERMEWARDYIGAQLYQSFSEKMDKVGSRLDAIAEEVGEILVENADKQGQRRLQREESVLSLYRYNHDNVMPQNPPPSTAEDESSACDYCLNLHLPSKQCEFFVQSKQGFWSFDAGPDTIIVTVGKRLEEWSSGEFKSVSGRIMYHPEDLKGCKASFSIELKWPSLTLYRSFKRNTYKKISLADQFLFALIAIFLYSIFLRFTW
ncbi:hypothetical protein SLE2022_342140 [Rubroshorea leprosula]